MSKKLYIPKRSERLSPDFFARPAQDVAMDLLGKTLVVERAQGCPLYARLHEVAGWEGETKTTSEGASYEPGILTMSTKFGNKLIDISTSQAGEPSCVTLIAGQVYDRVGDREFSQGAGNLSATLEIDHLLHNGHQIDQRPIWIAGQSVAPSEVKQRNKAAPENCVGYFYIQPEVGGR